MFPIVMFPLKNSRAPTYTVIIMLRPISVITLGNKSAITNWSFSDIELYFSLYLSKTFVKFISLTNDFINLIPENVSWTYVERSDNDFWISSDFLLIIFCTE